MSYAFSKLLPFAAVVINLSTLGQASHMKEELKSDQLFSKHPAQASLQDNSLVHPEMLEQLFQHIPIECKHYPDLYHQALTRSFKHCLRQQYQALDDLSDLEHRYDNLQDQQNSIDLVRQAISYSEQQITEHEQLLALHNATNNHQESNLIRDIQATIKRQRELIEELDKSEVSDEQKNRLRTAHSILENASQQSAILTIPLSQRRLEHTILVQDLKKLNDEMNQCQTVTPEIIADRREEHEELITNLINIRTKSVYKLETLLKLTKGYMFPYMMAKNTLIKISSGSANCMAYIMQLSDHSLLWHYMVHNLELPDPYFLDPIDDLAQHYIGHTQSLISLFEQRCQEDAATLTVLCRNLDDYNQSVQQQKGTPLEFDISNFVLPERELWAYLTGQDFNRTFNLIEPPIKLKLTELLTTHGAKISEHYIDKLTTQPIGLTGHILESLRRGGFYSWQSDHLLLVKANTKLKNQQNPSQEIMLAFYRLLGRITNKTALELSLEMVQSQSTMTQAAAKFSQAKRFQPFFTED